MRIAFDTEARNLHVYCTDCKTELILDIARGQPITLFPYTTLFRS